MSTIYRDIPDAEQLSMIGCGTIEVSEHGRQWECVLPYCDGEHHFMTLNSWEYR